ncbi:MAG: hypothetical protein U0Z44_18770 [Kouleothrix sp.]
MIAPSTPREREGLATALRAGVRRAHHHIGHAIGVDVAQAADRQAKLPTQRGAVVAPEQRAVGARVGIQATAAGRPEARERCPDDHIVVAVAVQVAGPGGVGAEAHAHRPMQLVDQGVVGARVDRGAPGERHWRVAAARPAHNIVGHTVAVGVAGPRHSVAVLVERVAGKRVQRRPARARKDIGLARAQAVRRAKRGSGNKFVHSVAGNIANILGLPAKAIAGLLAVEGVQRQRVGLAEWAGRQGRARYATRDHHPAQRAT